MVMLLLLIVVLQRLNFFVRNEVAIFVHLAPLTGLVHHEASTLEPYAGFVGVFPRTEWGTFIRLTAYLGRTFL